MKVKLTDEEVHQIFALRPCVNQHKSNALTSKVLAVRYRVTERTVRDIWSRRTRRDVTERALPAGEHFAPKTLKQGRPIGAKDGVPRHRQAVHQEPSDFTLSSGSDTTSEDSFPYDSVASTDGESSQGEADPLHKPASSLLEPAPNGFLFNQAILALLRQGIQQQPLGAPGRVPISQSSQFHPPVQYEYPNVFDALCPSVVPPSTTSPHARNSPPLPPDTSNVPPLPCLHASTVSMQSPQVPPFTSNDSFSFEPLSQLHAQQAPPAKLSQGNLSLSYSPSQLLEMLNTLASPSPNITTANINATPHFQIRVPTSGAANQAPALATRSNLELPGSFSGTPQGSTFTLPHTNGAAQRIFQGLPNNGVIPGEEASKLARMGESFAFGSLSTPAEQQQQNSVSSLSSMSSMSSINSVRNLRSLGSFNSLLILSEQQQQQQQQARAWREGCLELGPLNTRK